MVSPLTNSVQNFVLEVGFWARFHQVISKLDTVRNIA